MEWNKPGVPHKGWHCIDVEDIAEDADPTDEIEYEQCEMCGHEKLRFVHIMEHPEYPGTLRVGCVCAEKMSDDYVSPRKAEDTLRNRAIRRRNFLSKEWNFNPVKQTYSKKYKGEYITIKKSQYGNWGIFFAGNNVWKYNGRSIRSFGDAEKIAFNVFEQYHTTQEEREMQYWLSQRHF